MPGTTGNKPANKRRGSGSGTATTKTPAKPMTDAHKKALAEGREHAKIVGQYLIAVDQNRPKRGRKVTVESLQKRLNTVETKLAGQPDPKTKLELFQEQIDLNRSIAELSAASNGKDISALEDAFVGVAKAYATKKGIEREAFTKMGVPREVLKRAGI